jgi:uncharacterized protein YfaT (DUF1175 family)
MPERRRGRSGVLAALLPIILTWPLAAQMRLADESDRQAFRAWFVYIADARFERPAPDIIDCASFVRHAWREALRRHDAEWRRTAGLPLVPALPDVRKPPPASERAWPLFRVAQNPATPLREFADARTLIRFNTRPVARTVAAARPGDLLYFRQDGQQQPDHLMIVIGRSRFDPLGDDFLVYHTGRESATNPGELRKVRVADLLRHPAPRWRPVADNPNFVGVFRPSIL